MLNPKLSTTDNIQIYTVSRNYINKLIQCRSRRTYVLVAEMTHYIPLWLQTDVLLTHSKEILQPQDLERLKKNFCYNHGNRYFKITPQLSSKCGLKIFDYFLFFDILDVLRKILNLIYFLSKKA